MKRILRYLLPFILATSPCYALFFLPQSAAGYANPKLANEIYLIRAGAAKHVFIPHDSIATAWRESLAFADRAWQVCAGEPGGIGHEKNTGYEQRITLDVGAEMHADGGNPNNSCFIRIPFSISAQTIEKLEFLLLEMRFDDGFVAWLNGVQIASENAPDTLRWNSHATADNEAGEAFYFNISQHIDKLVPGENLLAIQGLNWYTKSSDFLITVELEGRESIAAGRENAKLPLVYIDHGGKPMPDEPKATVDFKILPAGQNAGGIAATEPLFTGMAGVEIRGKFSAKFPQKSYSIETRDAAGENLNISLLGMPPENDWILLGNYNDKSFVRNALAFDLFRRMGHYAPRTQFVEAIVNWNYRGIYLLTEKIKRDKNRVNIAKLRPEENDGDDLTGGYIIKIDYYRSDGSDSWASKFFQEGKAENRVRFVYHQPPADEISPQQKFYIQNWIHRAEAALFSDYFADPARGYRRYLDVPSFIDYFIISELSRNIDAYRKSRYFFKDKDSNGGLLHAGPVWDFDWAWKNIRDEQLGPTDGSGWVYQFNHGSRKINSPHWYERLMQDPEFVRELADRYFHFRANCLSFRSIHAYIEATRELLQKATDRHFALWPIELDYRAPEWDPPSQSYDEELAKLQAWIELRLNWLDEEFTEMRQQYATGITVEPMGDNSIWKVQNFPNPARGSFRVQSNVPLRKIVLYDLSGRQVLQRSCAQSLEEIFSTNSIAAGVYFLKVTDQHGRSTVLKQTVLSD